MKASLGLSSAALVIVVCLINSFTVSASQFYSAFPLSAATMAPYHALNSIPVPQLSSGWDDEAQKLYNMQKAYMAGLVTSNPEGTVKHRLLPLDEVTTVNEIMLPKDKWTIGNVRKGADGKPTSFFKKLGNGSGPSSWEPGELKAVA